MLKAFDNQFRKKTVMFTLKPMSGLPGFTWNNDFVMREIGSSQNQEQKDITACPHRTQQGNRGWAAERRAVKEINSPKKPSSA